MTEVQSHRFVAAALELLAEHGARGVTITGVCQRAALSRKTFCDLFGDLQGCLLAAFEHAARDATEATLAGVEPSAPPPARIRGALVALLRFLDEHPDAARLLFVHALAAGPRLAAARARLLHAVIAAVEREASHRQKQSTRPLTGEGAVGAVFSIIHARLLVMPTTAPCRPLTELAGQLTALLIGPYLGPAAARREIAAPSPKSRLTPDAPQPSLPHRSDPVAGLSLRMTYRTARVLDSIAQTPRTSSKQLAVASGIADQGQMSRLLARLQRHELIHNTGGDPARGEAHAWELTDRGHDVLHVIPRR